MNEITVGKMVGDSLLAQFLAEASELITLLFGAGLVMFGTWLSDRRRTRLEDERALQREQAILHGAFVVSNFIKERLNEWPTVPSTAQLSRLGIAQTYVRQLIDRSPTDSDRLMVALMDLGLRLDALLELPDAEISEKDTSEPTANVTLERCISELARSIDLVDIIVTGELPMMSEEELAELPGYQELVGDDKQSSETAGVQK